LNRVAIFAPERTSGQTDEDTNTALMIFIDLTINTFKDTVYPHYALHSA